MATPRVFVSSTFYDLRYIRENLKFFIRNMGFEPVLSEDGRVYYHPGMHVHEAAVAEVPNCQLFVLIIGGRSGTLYKGGQTTIVNEEYEQAVKAKIPIFALVDQDVLAQSEVYAKNATNPDVDADKVVYPAVDSVRVFQFIASVRANVRNNALVPFSRYEEMESYLRAQWSGMMFSFLTQQGESQRVASMLETLSVMNTRIEVLSKQILSSVGTDRAKLVARMYDVLLKSEAVRDLAILGIRPNPLQVMAEESYEALAGHQLIPEENEEHSYYISNGGKISPSRLQHNKREYEKLLEELRAILSSSGLSEEDLAAALADASA